MDVYGTAPTSSVVNAEESALVSGASLSAFVTTQADSSQSASNISTIYVEAAGGTPAAAATSSEQSILSSGGILQNIADEVSAIYQGSSPGSLGTSMLNFLIPSAQAAPIHNTAQQDAFFSTVDAPLTALAQQLGINSEWLLGLAAYESGWLDAHNTPLNNPFGLTYAGGKNIQFSNVSTRSTILPSNTDHN